MPTLFYIAAYAAIFLASRNKTLPAFMIFYMGLLYYQESIPLEYYAAYYVNTIHIDMVFVTMLSIFTFLSRDKLQCLGLMFLFALSVKNGFYGLGLYESYSEPGNYNLIGESIIILQILMTWTLRNGRFQPINSTVFRFRSRIRL